MRALEHLEPKNVFYFFEEICRIPHGSGNTEGISNYLAEFARERKLEYYQDEAGNVIIIKEAFAGYENHAPVMLQGHMDMVAVKEPGAPIDMEKDGLKLVVDGDRLMADGTSLGGDDGIAVAYGLALLDGTGYKHPRIELVITVDEEVGMDGARALDVTPLKAKQLVNLDSEEEGIFLSSCAGGARVDLHFDSEISIQRGVSCEINVCGPQGGHSGEEIHRERGNAICLLGRTLNRLLEKMELYLVDVKGGVADNAIPVQAKAKILITKYEKEDGLLQAVRGEDMEKECILLLKTVCEKLDQELKIELADKDSGVRIEVSTCKTEDEEVIDREESKILISLINSLPYGVQAMSRDMPGMVETSLNPGQIFMEGKRVSIGISVRSALESAKIALIGRLESLAYLAGADMEVTGVYPGWAYRKDSPLRSRMVEVYKNLYQKEPEIRAIHAGVECGLLADKISGLDCVSIGPDMKNIHTAKEELSISSAGRVWNYLIQLLEEL